MTAKKVSVFSIILSIFLIFSTAASSFDVSNTRTWFNNSNEQTRKNFQQFFKILGTKIINYNGYQGSIDGIWGKGTENAILQLFACFEASGINITSDEEVAKAFQKLNNDIATNSNISIKCNKTSSASHSIKSEKNYKFGYKYKGYLQPTKHEKCWVEPFKTEFCDSDTGKTLKIPIEISFSPIADNRGRRAEFGTLYINIKGKTVLLDNIKMMNRTGNFFDHYDAICPPAVFEVEGLEYCYWNNRFGELKFLDKSFEKARGKVSTVLWPKPYGQVHVELDLSLNYSEPEKLSGLAYDNFFIELNSPYIKDRLIQKSFTPKEIKLLQNSLKAAGFYTGQINGGWGTEIAKATALAFTINKNILPSGPKVTRNNIEFLFSNKFKETYDKNFAKSEQAKRELLLEKENQRKAAERQKQIELRKKLENNRKLAQADLEKKLTDFENKRNLELNSNFGFRSLKPSMKMEDALEECGYILSSRNGVNCYDIDNIMFFGNYRSVIVKSEVFEQQSVSKEVKTLSKLKLDLGPISQSWVSYLPSGSKDINDGDILQKMRNNLSKYDLVFEYSQRDIELFNAGEKDSLIVVYEKGKVVLRIQRISKDYSFENRLYLEYRDAEEAKQYLEENIPKKATADDF